MTNEQKAQMFLMKLNGMSYESIAQEMNCTRQNVQQTLADALPMSRCTKRKKYVNRITTIYPVLQEALYRRGIVQREFAALIGTSYKTTRFKMQGINDFTLREIRKILEITGLTFDEAFSVVELPDRADSDAE